MNDRELILNQYKSNCVNCKHYKGLNDNFEPHCKAFEVIPIDILRGNNKHTEPTKTQVNKTVFEPKKGA